MATRLKFFTGRAHIAQIAAVFEKCDFKVTQGTENLFVHVPEMWQLLTVVEAADEILTYVEEIHGTTCGLSAADAREA